jgi:hypothetical protein
MHTKKSLVILVAAVFVVFSFTIPIDNTNAGLECPVGWDDCDCDGICEMNVLSDPFNCGKCGNVCASKNCVNGSCVPVIGGLVPCGRLFDNPDTVWSEQEDCKLCHTIVLADSFIDYLIEIAAFVAILIIVVGGILYISSAGDASKTTIAKTAITKSLYGFVIVFIAWVAINTSMVLFGFEDPLGDGSWHKFDCELMSGPITNYYCGDGSVNNPNDDGIAEVCDPQELKNDFIARKTALAVGCADDDGTCPDGCFSDAGATTDNNCPFAAAAWVEEIYSCNPVTCNFGCTEDLLVDEIGEGCYLDLNSSGTRDADECQKGRYVCDFATDVVVCENTYNDLSYKLAGDMCSDIYDYCCERFNDWDGFDPTVFNGAQIIYPGSTYSCSADGCDGHVESGIGDSGYIQLTDFVGSTPNPPYTFYYTYNCDEVCKNHGGEICIGVGLSDLNTHSCYNIRCDSGADCTSNPGNLVPVDCTAVFRYWDSHSCWDNPHVFPVGSTACICK